MCYRKTMKIFNLEKNMETIINNDDIYEYESKYGISQKIKKEEKRINEVLANYSDTLFFGKDNKGNLNLYSFNNNTLGAYYNFEIMNIKGVIKLKNNDFLFYSNNCELYKYIPIFLNKNK